MLLIRVSLQNQFALFHPSNTIYIPLDPKHALFITPNNVGSILNKVQYQKDDYLQYLVLNDCTKRNAEKWLIGTEKGIDGFIASDKIASEPAGDDHPLIQGFIRRNQILEHLLPLVERDLSSENRELVAYLNKIENDPIVKESSDLREMIQNTRIGIERTDIERNRKKK